MQELCVVPSFNRPAVSNDNPYSEAVFRTLRYHPRYPRQLFKSLPHARAWMHGFVRWYNNKALLTHRRKVYEAARARYPEWWTGAVRNWARIDVVHLNPEKRHTVSEMSETTLKKVT